MASNFLSFCLLSSLILTMITSRTASAEDYRVWIKSHNNLGISDYYVMSAQEETYNVSVFRVNGESFQQKVFEQIFQDQNEAQRYIELAMKSDVGYHIIRTQKKNVTPKFGTPLWKATQQWNEEWEKKYSNWIALNATTDFFIKQKISTDCADAIYAFRFIFAREFQLPFVARLVATGKVFSHDMIPAIWEKLPTAKDWYNDKKFLAALSYLLDNTYTVTLRNDSYPIKLDETSMRGSHYFEPPREGVQNAGSNHVVMIKSVNPSDLLNPLIMTISSSVPKAKRYLTETGFLYPKQPLVNEGFRKFRWPKKIKNGWGLVESKEMPGYSEEQFDTKLLGEETNFTTALFKRLNPEFKPTTLVRSGISQLLSQLKTRQEIVGQGFEVCSKSACEPNSQNYENFSTPSRDAKIKGLFLLTQKLVDDLANVDSEVMDIWYQGLNQTAIRFEDSKVSLRTLKFIWDIGAYNSDPNQLPQVRWGITAEVVANYISQKIEKIEGKSTRKSLAERLNTSTNAEIKEISAKLINFCENFPEEECHRFSDLLN